MKSPPDWICHCLWREKHTGDQAEQDHGQIDDDQNFKPHRSLGLLQMSENASITASYRFRPTLFATLLTAVMVGIFTSLSVWQYHRAQYKQQVAQDIARQITLPAINLNQHKVEWPAQRYRPAQVSGTWETGSTLLLDNIVHQGKAGYHVITPLKLDATGEHVLVNRGWVEVGADRKVLPNITTPVGGAAVRHTGFPTFQTCVFVRRHPGGCRRQPALALP